MAARAGGLLVAAAPSGSRVRRRTTARRAQPRGFAAARRSRGVGSMPMTKMRFVELLFLKFNVRHDDPSS